MASCVLCPAKVDSAGLSIEEVEDLHGWTYSREAGEYVCACCYVEEKKRIEAEFGWMVPHVRQANAMRRDGDSAGADALAFAVAGVLS